MKVYLKGRRCNAVGEFAKGKITILPGSKLSDSFSENFAGNKRVMKYRMDKSFIGNDGVVKKEVKFLSPSTAAQFIKGYSTNGWKCWKDSKGNTLEKYKEI